MTAACLALGALSGCGESASGPLQVQQAPANVSTSTVQPAVGQSLQTLQQENEALKTEIGELKQLVADLRQTPQMLLEKVHKQVKGKDIAGATSALAALEKRYGNVPQLAIAHQAVKGLEVAQKEAQEQARRLDAMGIYALKKKPSPSVGTVVIKVEALRFGNQWTFDSYGDEFFYREPQRGEQFLLMNVVLQSKDKSPQLPDVGVYRIDGKTMKRVSNFNYEFRRWSSHGTYIGLYHDFKNDFAHTSAIPFNAAARLSNEDAKQPLAVVVTGYLCHERGSRIGQPEVEYRRRYDCPAKDDLTPDDVLKGDYHIIEFLNKPRGG